MNNSISTDLYHMTSMMKYEVLAKEKNYRLLIDGQAGLLLPEAQSSNWVSESSVNDQIKRRANQNHGKCIGADRQLEKLH